MTTSEITEAELKQQRMKIRLERVRRMHEQGMFNSEIGKEIGVTGTQVARYLKYLKLVRNFHPELKHTPPQARTKHQREYPEAGNSVVRAPNGLVAPNYTCTYGTCDRRQWKDKLCNGHWHRREKGQDMDGKLRARHDAKPHCKVSGCGRYAERFTTELCRTHNERRVRGVQDWDKPIIPKRHNVMEYGPIHVHHLLYKPLMAETKRLCMTPRQMIVRIVERFVRERLIDGGDE